MRFLRKLTPALLCASLALLLPSVPGMSGSARADDLADPFGAAAPPPPADGTRGKDSKGNAFRYLNGGIVFYDEGGFAQQIEDLTAAIKADPSKADLYLQRARAYLGVLRPREFGGGVDHDYFDADKDLGKAIELDPKLADAWEERARAVQSPMLTEDKNSILRGLPEALSDANQAIALQPGNAAFYTGRGSLYLRAIDEERNIIHSSTTPKQIEDAARNAEADFTKALTLNPKTPDAARYRAIARLKLDAAPALINADLAQAVALDPKDVQAQGMRVDAALAQGDWATARTASDAVIALRPDFPLTYLARARARFNLKDPDGAIADASQAVSQAGDDKSLLSEALLLRGELYTAQGKAEPALADFAQATTADPSNADAWDGLGQVQSDSGKLAEAVATYQHGLEKLPTVYIFHLRLALLAAYRDDPATVKKEYAAALPQVTAADLQAQAAIVEAALKTRPKSPGLLAAQEALKDAAQKVSVKTNASKG